MQENVQDGAGDNAVRSTIGICTIRTASEVEWMSRDWPVSVYRPVTHFLTATAHVQTMTGRQSVPLVSVVSVVSGQCSLVVSLVSSRRTWHLVAVGTLWCLRLISEVLRSTSMKRISARHSTDPPSLPLARGTAWRYYIDVICPS